METDRTVTSRSGERPVTRWRRESEKSQTYSERPESGVSRPYSKMERPTSRRGVKSDISDYGMSRPPTSRKSFSSRPPSAGLLSNRASTPSSRINTMSSANSARIGSGIPRNTMILDRPVTQQGLVGVRPSSSKSASRRARRSQDKEYYQQLLQLKVQELSKEVQEMTGKIDKLKATYQDEKAEDLTDELIKLQSQLSHYTIVLNKLNASSNREKTEQRSNQVRDHNNHEAMDIETIITKYHQAKDKLDDLRKKIESEQKIGSIDLELKRKYDEALKEKLELQQKVESMQIDYEQLSEISPENFMINDGMNVTDQKSEEVKKDTESNPISGVNLKKVDKKQEEIMDIFKSTFERNRAEELEKLNTLEEQIARRLEQISNNINENIDSSVLQPDEMEILNTLMDRNSENRSNKSFEELRQDNLKLRQISSKLEVIESKIKNRMLEVKEKTESMSITSADDLERKGESFEDNEDLSMEREFLFAQERNQPPKDYTKLKEKIEKNELYRSISILEDKLKSVGIDSDQFESPIEDSTEELDHPSLMAKLLSLMARYNTFLINDIKRYQTVMF